MHYEKLLQRSSDLDCILYASVPMGILHALQLRIAHSAASWHSMSALGSLSYGMPAAFVCMILRNTMCSRLIIDHKNDAPPRLKSRGLQRRSFLEMLANSSLPLRARFSLRICDIILLLV